MNDKNRAIAHVSPVALAPTMSESEARRATDEVRRELFTLAERILDLHDRGAWMALGYMSWAAYVKAEFHRSRSWAYQQLDLARLRAQVSTLVDNLEVGGLTERQARVLAPLDEPELAHVAEQVREVGGFHEITSGGLRRPVERATGDYREQQEALRRLQDALRTVGVVSLEEVEAVLDGMDEAKAYRLHRDLEFAIGRLARVRDAIPDEATLKLRAWTPA